MTEAELVKILGEPIRVNITATQYGRSDQRIYRKWYVYVESGVVTGFQNK